KPRLRPRRAQLLDKAETDAAATVDGEPGGFVDGHQRLVLVEDGQGDGARRLLCRRGPGGDANRRDAQVVPKREAGLRPHALAIDPDLPAAQDAVDVALGHSL